MKSRSNIKIEMMIHCHNFQRRLAWVLSSIHQQIGDLPLLTVNIASFPGNGSPSTEDLVRAFHRMPGGYKFSVKHTVIDDPEIMAKRGLTRNVQLQNCDANWVYFADADNVFEPTYFARLKEELLANNEWRVIITSLPKRHTDILATRKKIEEMTSVYICDAYEKAKQIPKVKIPNRWVAAGCMQIVRNAFIKEQLECLYVKPHRCRDFHLFKIGQRARSDIQFRKRVRHTTFIKLPMQIHLNHERDKEIGGHSERQR